jgi:putative alpha-1,2-mannosidase
VAGVMLNGQPLEVPWFRHADIAAGGQLRFELSAEPTDWGRISAEQRVPTRGE